ncbi:MAG TPA: CpsD/CapB family tyrosine-protein kinase [Terriglobia bacterium]|nr:CpsD/CapB family tyrosine-protein kinase [Terriglobia bacterium]
MSHVFDALKKAEGKNSDGAYVSPESFFETIEETSELIAVPSERANLGPESRLVVWSNPRSLGADRFRLLRMQLQKLQERGKLKKLLLTSPFPQDGKSTVSLNLATALAGQGKQKVLLMEADLRCPSLLLRLGLKPWPGLSECLQCGSDPVSTLRRIEPLDFYLLPSGASDTNPTELLQSERFAQVVKDLSGYFDWILIDSPPTSPIADTLALKQQTDGCLLIARSGKTPRESVEEAIRQFGPGYVIGIVLNGLEGLEREYSEYYRKYYGQTGPASSEASKVQAK